MGLEIDSRPSDSPFIHRVWRSRSTADVTAMTSVASPYVDLAFHQHRGRFHAGVLGPESRASRAPVPEDAVFFGINLAAGAWLSHLPPARLVDGAVQIPDATRRSLWLKGSHWDVPDYDNAEEFIRRLEREDVLSWDPLVAAALRGAPPQASERTIQRRFVAATGLTPGTVRRIARARQAAVLLRDGVQPHDVVHRLGYYDQPHLARSLTRFIGRTATQLRDREPPEPMSLLYKT